MSYTDRVRFPIGGLMTRALYILVVLGSVAAGPVQAADQSAGTSKSSSKAERAVDNTGKKLGKTADRAEKSVKKGLGRAEKAINTAGEKTGRWLNEKTK